MVNRNGFISDDGSEADGTTTAVTTVDYREPDGSTRSVNYGQFRPSSQKDFLQYAKDLSAVSGMKLQASQEFLAQAYGYSGLHELQAEMEKPGQPGPFETDFPFPAYAALECLPKPGRHTIEEFEAESFRRRKLSRRLATLYTRPESSLNLAAMCKIEELGLFHSPAQHRELFKRLSGASSASWPIGMWGLLEQAYCPPYEVVDDCHWHFQGGGSPVDQAQTVFYNASKFAEGALYLESVPQDILAIVSELPIADTDYVPSPGYNTQEYENRDWVDFVLQRNGLERRKVPAEEMERLLQFLRNPMQSNLVDSALLAKVPDARMLAQRWHEISVAKSAMEQLRMSLREGPEMHLHTSSETYDCFSCVRGHSSEYIRNGFEAWEGESAFIKRPRETGQPGKVVGTLVFSILCPWAGGSASPDGLLKTAERCGGEHSELAKDVVERFLPLEALGRKRLSHESCRDNAFAKLTLCVKPDATEDVVTMAEMLNLWLASLANPSAYQAGGYLKNFEVSETVQDTLKNLQLDAEGHFKRPTVLFVETRTATAYADIPEPFDVDHNYNVRFQSPESLKDRVEATVFYS